MGKEARLWSQCLQPGFFPGVWDLQRQLGHPEGSEMHAKLTAILFFFLYLSVISRFWKKSQNVKDILRVRL